MGRSTLGIGRPRGRISICRAAIVVCLMLAGLSVVTQEANAATIYQQTGGQFEGEFRPTTAIAVDDATGDVISGGVDMNGTGAGGLAVYTPEGSGLKYVEVLSEPAVGSVGKLVIDEASRSLYLTESGGTEIRKFSISGTTTLTLTPDPAFTSPTQGSGPGQIGSFTSPMAVDPTTGDLLVADTGNGRVDRFASDGSFISSFDGSDATAGPFSLLEGIAVGATGEIYVVNAIALSFGNEAPLERFSPTGVADNAFRPPIPIAHSVVADPDSGNIVVFAQSGGFGSPGALFSIAGDSIIQEELLPSTTTGFPAPLGVGAHRLYVLASTSSGALDYHIFDGLIGPDAIVGDATGIGQTAATIPGTVQPHGIETSYWIEYSREGGPSQKTPEEPAGEGEGAVPVTVQLTGLLPNSEYSFRLVAKNAAVSLSSEAKTFKTAGAPPRVNTGGASNASVSSVKLLGAINPLGSQTTYFFEYGSSSPYGARIPVRGGGLAGAGREELAVSQEIAGLQAGTTYHYRLVAVNGFGTTLGEDETFTTPAANAPARAYELVTPNEKGNSFANPLFMHATPSGDQVTYLMQTAIPGLGGAAPKLDRYTALRSGEGWRTVALEPHNVQVGLDSASFENVLGIAEDGSKAVVASSALLAPGGREGGTNLYLYDVATDTYQTMLSNSSPEAFKKWTSLQSRNPGVILGGTPDYSRVFFETGTAASAEVVEGVLVPSSFEWSQSTGLRVVAENTLQTARYQDSNPHWISEDGTTLFYTSFADFRLHAQVRGTDSVISPEFAEFSGASADGTIVFYVEEGVLYRYDLLTEQREPISGGVDLGENAWAVSRDGSTVFFQEDGTGGAFGGGLTVWHAGRLRQIYAESSIPVNREASPNGRYALFGSTLKLTGYENEGTEEIYRYDVANEELSCASCRQDGGKPLGPARMTEEEYPFEPYKPRAILDSGLALFDTPDPLVPGDVNASRDVYSFDGKTQTLISSGTGASDSNFADASESGNDVFFTTSDRLVKGDTNSDVDVYDARVGGGISSQNVEPEGASCSGVACRSSGAAAPALGPMPSEGPGIQATPRRRHGAKKKAHRAKCHKPVKKGKQGARQCTKAKNHKRRSQGR
jgi:Tol biopolymer transport system component